MSESMYEKAGVNIDKGNQAVDNIKNLVKKMGVKEIGKFSGFFPLGNEYKNPTLVSSADGVGTKLKIAFMMDKHDTIGRDIVNHCVDDIIVYGSKPLFFLDYIATGNLKPEVITDIVSGMLNACLENDFVLLGGETAEMPGFYKDKEYDVAGFIVGMVDKDKIIDGTKIKEGDLLIGLPSNGLHTNGYSLARYIAFEKMKLKVDSNVEGLDGTIGEELLKSHISYLKHIQTLQADNLLKGIAHITGGGFIENIPRILPEGLGAKIQKVWVVPEIFKYLVKAGKVRDEEKYRVFNMGIGMVLIIDKKDLSKVEEKLTEIGENYYLIGQITKQKGNKRIIVS